MGLFDLVATYLKQGGMVSFALLIVFIVISYSAGFRIAVLFKGRNLDARQIYANPKLEGKSIQVQFLNELKEADFLSKESLERHIDWLLKDTYQQIHAFSFVLTTAVVLAPLLGLLGTVIGMIETFASLSDADLFSSSGGIAGGISQALITTQFGLVVAVPGIFISKYLMKIEKKTYSDVIQLKDLYLQNLAGDNQ